jgi:hypothetical protein
MSTVRRWVIGQRHGKQAQSVAEPAATPTGGSPGEASLTRWTKRLTVATWALTITTGMLVGYHLGEAVMHVFMHG